MKEFFKEKGIGFYVLVISVLLTITTAIVYWVNYSKTGEINLEMMTKWGFSFLIIGTVSAVGLASFKQTAFWAPIALAICNFIALLFYVVKIYQYVAIVFVGIDISTISPRFLSTTLLIGITAVISIVGVFFKQLKESEA